MELVCCECEDHFYIEIPPDEEARYDEEGEFDCECPLCGAWGDHEIATE